MLVNSIRPFYLIHFHHYGIHVDDPTIVGIFGVAGTMMARFTVDIAWNWTWSVDGHL